LSKDYLPVPLLEIFSPAGAKIYLTHFDVERYYRDIRITRIYEGTNEIQKNIISRDVLKKDPRVWY